MTNVVIYLKKYSNYPLSHNDYLLSFKSLCDNSSDLICIIDTSPDFLLLYASKGFGDKLGWTANDIYQKSIMEFITQQYHANLQKTLHNTLDDDTELCIRLRVIKKPQVKEQDEESIVVICNTQKIDNIISCTMRIVEKNI